MPPIVAFNSASGKLKAHLFDLADQDRAALAEIREQLEIPSNALAVRLAIRYLARRLSEPGILAKKETVRLAPDGEAEIAPTAKEV